MASLNKVMLIGRLGQDPTKRDTKSGFLVEASLATTMSRKNQNGGKIEETEWHRLVFFDRIAEIALQYTHKGSQIYVEGRLKTDHYEKDGVKKSSTRIIVSSLQLLDSKKQEGGNAQQYQAPQSAPPQQRLEGYDEDVPF